MAAVEQRALLVGAAVADVYRVVWSAAISLSPAIAPLSRSRRPGASGTSGPKVNWLTACRTKHVVVCDLFEDLRPAFKANLFGARNQMRTRKSISLATVMSTSLLLFPAVDASAGCQVTLKGAYTTSVAGASKLVVYLNGIRPDNTGNKTSQVRVKLGTWYRIKGCTWSTRTYDPGGSFSVACTWILAVTQTADIGFMCVLWMTPALSSMMASTTFHLLMAGQRERRSISAIWAGFCSSRSPGRKAVQPRFMSAPRLPRQVGMRGIERAGRVVLPPTSR